MPISVSCPNCQRAFRLRDELAGRKMRCPECESVVEIPDVEDVVFEDDDKPQAPWHPAFDHDRFLLRQKLMSITERYYVHDEYDQPILYIERPAHLGRNLLAAFVTVIVAVTGLLLSIIIGLGLMETVAPKWIGAAVLVLALVLTAILACVIAVALSPKRHVSFYRDDSKAELLLQILQDQKFAPITATYTVVTPDGEPLWKITKNYLYNVFRKKWEVHGPGGVTVLIAREDSLFWSLLRRALAASMDVGFLRTNFILIVPGEDDVEETRGEFNRKLTLFDRYVLDLRGDRPPLIDRRLALAIGVLLDTGEGR